METVLDSLVVKIRADTQGLDQGIAAARANVQGLRDVSEQVNVSAASLNDNALTFAGALERTTEVATQRMGAAFERMARSGKLSFDSLQNSALAALAQIVTSYAGAGLERLFAGGGGGGFWSSLLPGRAGGGSVSPGEGYMVGERGPELFIPSASGRIAAPPSPSSVPQRRSDGRATSITINIQTSGGAEGVRQSGAQVARAVRRALAR